KRKSDQIRTIGGPDCQPYIEHDFTNKRPSRKLTCKCKLSSRKRRISLQDEGGFLLMEMAAKDRFKALECCVIVPTYNNDGTLKAVIDQLLSYTDDLLVINDGATDNTPAILEAFEDRITIITHEQNQGKGKALRNGFAVALEKGYRYAITIDSD